MKRMAALLVAFMVAILAWGCSGSQDARSEEEAVDSSAVASVEDSSQESTDAGSEASPDASLSASAQSKPARNGYDETTNHSLEVAGLAFSVPSCFEASEDSSDDGSKFYYAESGSSVVMLMTQVADFKDSKLDRVDFDAAKDDFAEGVNGSFTSSEVLESRDFELAGLSARRVSLSSQLQGVDFLIDYVFFFNQERGEIGLVSFGQSDNSSYDYSADIDKVIASAKPAVDEAALAKEQAQKTLGAVKLAQKRDALEYSKKGVDPLKFVECDNPDVKVSVRGTIDLAKVGQQEVVYVLTLDGESVERTMTFNVRDTKAPKINFKNKAPSVELDGSYDPEDNVKWVKDPVDGKLELVDEVPDEIGDKDDGEAVYERGWYTVEGNVDTSTPGSYDIKVTASDVYGNVATRTFAVKVKQPEAVAGAAAPAAGNEHTYIVNRNNGTFHIPGCRDVNRMKESNKQEVRKTREEMMAEGYHPCGHCNP